MSVHVAEEVNICSMTTSVTSPPCITQDQQNFAPLDMPGLVSGLSGQQAWPGISKKILVEAGA